MTWSAPSHVEFCSAAMRAALRTSSWMNTSVAPSVLAINRSASESHAHLVQSMIDGVMPCRMDEVDYLAVHWPEFRAFLVQHGLTGDLYANQMGS